VTDIGSTFLGPIQGLPDTSVEFYSHSPAGAMDVLGECLRYQEWEDGFYAESGVIIVEAPSGEFRPLIYFNTPQK
jgi:hypothetical protein